MINFFRKGAYCFIAVLVFLLLAHNAAAVANFSVNVTQLFTSPTTVSQGQTGIIIDVTITNTPALGTDSENVNITSVGLIFHNGTALYQVTNTNASINYTISLQNATPIVINGSAIGGNTTYLRFIVNISSLALTGTIYINASVNATNSSIFSSSGANTTDVGFRFGDSWTVQTPAKLNITNISASPFTLSPSNSITLSLAVANLGEATADVTSGSNVTNATVLGFLANLTSTAVSGLSVVRADSVSTITGGSTATLQFTISAGTSTYNGNVTVNATLSFNDTNTGQAAPTSANQSSRDSAFQIDSIRPTLSGSITITTNRGTATVSLSMTESATCTYQVEGQQGSTNFQTTGGTNQLTTITFGTNGIRRLLITCTDVNGNVNSFFSGFFAIVLGGGSGGAGAGGNSVQTSSTGANQEAVFNFDHVEATGVLSIMVTTNHPINNIRLTVDKLLVNPAAPAITGEEGNIYKYILINKVNLQESDIQNAKIKFEIEKAWLQTYNHAPNTVALMRLQSDGWKALPTQQISEDEQYVVYEATTPGFSTFAITAGYKEIPTSEQPQVAPVVSPPVTPAKVQPTPVKSPPSTPISSSPTGAAIAETPVNPSVSVSEASENSNGMNPLVYVGMLLFVLLIIYYVYSATIKRR